MNIAKDAALLAIAPKVAKSFRLSWLVYGAVAYFGIRYLNKKGVMTKQTGAALDLVDRGISTAKEQLGLSGASTNSAQPNIENNIH